MKREIRLGILIVLTIIVSIWGYKYLKGKNVFSNVKVVQVKFNEVDNLEIASPVAIRGFKVGSVLDLEIDPENVDNIIVTFDVEGDIALPKNTIAELKSAGVMGGRYIELVFDSLCNGSDCLEDGDYVNGATSGMLASFLSTEELDGYVQRIGTGMDTIMGRLSTMDETNPLTVTFENLELAMANLNNITIKIDRMLANTTKNVSQAMDNLNSISKNLADNNAMITKVLSNIEVVTKDLTEANISGTIGTANNALATTEQAVAELKNLINNTKTSITGLNSVISKMETGDGSMAKLINDGALYENLNSTSKNLDFLLQDLRLNPKRYVKVSVFGKKDSEPYVLPEDDPASGSQ